MHFKSLVVVIVVVVGQRTCTFYLKYLKIDQNTSRRHRKQHTSQRNKLSETHFTVSLGSFALGVPLFSWVLLFRWIRLFLWIPFCRWIPLLLWYNAIQQNNKNRGSTAEAVACKSGHRALGAQARAVSEAAWDLLAKMQVPLSPNPLSPCHTASTDDPIFLHTQAYLTRQHSTTITTTKY